MATEPDGPPTEFASYGATPPNPYGAYQAADGLGGIAAPLLAAAAVTLLGLVLQIETVLRWPSLSLLLFGAAIILLLRAVQSHARARGYSVTPSEALAWYPDAADMQRRRVVQWELRRHQAAWRFWIGRARRHYNLGVLFLLIGAAVLLVPADPQKLTATRWAAIAVLVWGCVAETMAILIAWRRPDWWARWWAADPDRRRPLRWLNRLVRWVAPPDPPVSPPDPDLTEHPHPGPADPPGGGQAADGDPTPRSAG
ncbi:hypothetical protein O7614_21570 [Micromonospora sp. WMMD961]|uniref:hypothetical protein n=1 Tax=Micromonospora sp. WMMD961 TaxID=3016100 RepID=UPI00241756DA|nr:hypothetical protein [Micromonospora sp. WMMD961]MDG4782254.1 hypothetical protein [Micromonospora sp. WMMD961]